MESDAPGTIRGSRGGIVYVPGTPGKRVRRAAARLDQRIRRAPESHKRWDAEVGFTKPGSLSGRK